MISKNLPESQSYWLKLENVATLKELLKCCDCPIAASKRKNIILFWWLRKQNEETREF